MAKTSVKLISEKFPKSEWVSLSNSDKKTIAIVKKLMTSAGKSGKIKLPLSSSIDVESTKTVSVDVPSLVRVQFAILKECSIVFTYEEQKDLNGENFRIYYAMKKVNFNLPSEVLREPRKNEQKRKGNSGKTSTEQKKENEVKAKAIEAKESADNNEWNKKASQAIIDHLIGKYKIDCENIVVLEREIIAILERVR